MSDKPSSVMAEVLRPSPAQVACENISRDLETYVRKMGLGTPIDSTEGGQMQRMLWRAIKTTLREDGPVFAAVWSSLLKIVSENRGEKQCFNEAAVFRFADSAPIPPDELQIFQRVLHLILNTCDPGTRLLKVRHIDLNLVVKGLPGAHGDKIKAFYTDY